jgi:hypothetical protein
MNEFEKNHPKELENFLDKLHRLIDDYHHEIYLIDGIFEGYHRIITAVHDEMKNLEKQNK